MEWAIKVRQADANDLKKVKEIIDLSFPRFFRFFASRSVSDLEMPFLVAGFEGSVFGFAKLIEFKVGGRQYGCILWIAVHPAHRRKGIAYLLTNAGVECLLSRGALAVFASTQRRNKAAQATLRKSKFEGVGFVGLMRLFGWRVINIYNEIWYAPGELVFIRDLPKSDC